MTCVAFDCKSKMLLDVSSWLAVTFLWHGQQEERRRTEQQRDAFQLAYETLGRISRQLKHLRGPFPKPFSV